MSIIENWKFIGIDDANLLFDASFEKRPDLGLPIIHHLLTTVRKSRMNIFCCTQTPHQLGASINSNSALKIMFSLSNGQDIEFMHKSIGNLDKDQKAFTYNLRERQIIIKNTLRFPIPILGIVPELPPAREVTDSEIAENNALILSQLPDIQPRYSPKKQSDEKTSKTSRSSTNNISDDLKTFLMAVNLYQYKKPSSEISNLAGFSAGTGSRILQECEKKNLVKTIALGFGKGNPKYPVLLPDGYNMIGIGEKKFYGKGAGYQHVLYQHLIAQHFEDYKPVIELNRGGKFIDVAIEINQKLICIEVAMTSTHEKENIERDFSLAKAEFVLVGCRDENVQMKVQAILLDLPPEYRTKTHVCLISEILKKKPDEFVTKS